MTSQPGDEAVPPKAAEADGELVACHVCHRLIEPGAVKCEGCGQYWKTHRPEFEIELIQLGRAMRDSMRASANLLALEVEATASTVALQLIENSPKNMTASQTEKAAAVARALKEVAVVTADGVRATAEGWEPIIEAAAAQLSFIELRDAMAVVTSTMHQNAAAAAAALEKLAAVTVQGAAAND